MAAVYSESKKHPGQFSVRVGAHSPGKAFNIQKNISRAEAAAYKAAPIPEGGNDGWEDMDQSGGDFILDATRDLSGLLPMLLPHNHPDSLADFEVRVAFRQAGAQKIKACLYNRQSDTFWFVTGTNSEPSEKNIRAARQGWFVYNSRLTAPAPFWRKVCESI